jgi:gliding motility-associated protein GldM
MSGAANCAETPRQKMIGMMYLVLTAMLAINVSASVLKGYQMVDDSMHFSLITSTRRNEGLYKDFDAMYQKNPTKVKEWLDKAHKVKEESDKFFNYIETFKENMVKLQIKDKYVKNDTSTYTRSLEDPGNYDVPGEYAILMGNGEKFEEAMNEYSHFLQELVKSDPVKVATYKNMFSTEPVNHVEWPEATFEHMPIGAVLAVLTKYQNDIRVAESEVLSFLKSQTDAADLRVNKLEALVIPKSQYVMKGAKYTAKIVLSAVDSTARPEIIVGGSTVKDGIYEVMCSKIGISKFSGMIKLTGNDGNVITRPFESEYIVGEPSATLSNEDLNVVYRGVDNKFRISVPGFADDLVSIKPVGGTATKVNGKYIIKPTQDGEMTINVFAKVDGKDMQMGSEKYRVKYLPDPKSFLQYVDGGGVPRNIQDGTLSKRALKGAGVQIIASYGDDVLIKANFQVVSFNMVSPFGNTPQQGCKFNNKQMSDIDKLEGGDAITIKNVKAVGPDGKIRSLGMIQITI